MLRVAAASLMIATFSGCGTDKAALKEASIDKGIAAARVTLPPLPGDCRAIEPHAAINVGDEVRSVLKAERRQLNKANDRVGRCAAHYDRTARALK